MDIKTGNKFDLFVYKIISDLICPFAFILSLWTMSDTVVEMVRRGAFAEYKWSLLFAAVDLANAGLLWYGLANFKKFGLWLMYINIAVLIVMRVVGMYQQKSMYGWFLTIVFVVVLGCFIRIRGDFS